ncbi:MAG: group II intron reverse transcriptase/maturase [Synergistaceae bacterium]|nr:group II intron reverse transcriptase/maturase [Synergistaceae bacterium]
MQRKLATWSEEDKARRFYRLLRIVSDPIWLEEAICRTLGARGATTPGIDGMTRAHVENNITELARTIGKELRAGTYEPQPVRRVNIRKSNGKLRPLGIPTLKDRIVQRAMLMAMDPIWESDFHNLSYGFRPCRSVHQAIRTVKLQLQDSHMGEAARWIIEGDLTSYFDTIHHGLLMKAARRRIRDRRFLNLLWKFLKAGHVDKRLFHAAHDGVPQGGVISPLLGNIMLNEFDTYLENRYLSKKARKDRWYWNDSLKRKRPRAIEEGREWKPAVAYCRYADDFLIAVKGTRAQAEEIRQESKEHLHNNLRLVLNMEKTRITHVNDGFVFLGHRIIRKRGKKGTMRVTDGIPREKVSGFIYRIKKHLDENHHMSGAEMIKSLNLKIEGWGRFYQYADQKSWAFDKVDRAVFWKMAHWLGNKYRSPIKPLVKKWVKHPEEGKAKTWVMYDRTSDGKPRRAALSRLVGRGGKQYRWKQQQGNPYMAEPEERTRAPRSRYDEVAMAVSQR